MAETYICNGEMVHFSNGACQVLQLTWAKIAEERSDESGMRELSEALNRASEHATGLSAVGIDSECLGEPFSLKRVKLAWLETMRVLIDDIRCCGPISAGMDVTWDSELRESWIARLTKMANCLEAQVET